MAQPSPTFVTPSTTVVNIDGLQTPYTPVLLNPYSYTGQLVTIQDTTSSSGILYSSIVVSTTSAFFSDNSVSTLITQPQGFLTLQSSSPSTWSILNTFPFWNQGTSATANTLTTSTLNVAVLSTLQEYTSSLVVENLLVSGNFSISSGLLLNQSVSSFGAVSLYSSLTVWQTAFLSSSLSTLGPVQLQSLTVGTTFVTSSPLEFLSSVYVSTSVSAVGYLSTSLVNLSGTFATASLFVTNSSPVSVITGGSLLSYNLQVGSSINVGFDFVGSQTSVSSFSSFSTMAIYDSLEVNTSTRIQGSVSTGGPFVTLGTLSTLSILINDSFLVHSNLNVGGAVVIPELLSTIDFQANSAVVQGDLHVNPAIAGSTRAEDVTVFGTLGIGALDANTLTIGGSLSTPLTAVLEGSVFVQSTLFVASYLSTLSSFSTQGDLYTLGNLSTHNSVFVTGAASLGSNFVVDNTSYWNDSNCSTSHILGDLSVLENLTLSQTLKLSSITLPLNLVTNNFEVSTLFVGYGGVTNNAVISTLFTSSITTGGLDSAQYPMDMINDLFVPNLSTLTISTLEFNAASQGTFAQSTFFYVLSSFGVDIGASTNTVDINTIAYTVSNAYVQKSISANTILATSITGTLFGDGRLLSNVHFPQSLSTETVFTSSLIAGIINTSTFIGSSLTTFKLLPLSTLRVGELSIFGNANGDPLDATNCIAGLYPNPGNTQYQGVKLNTLYAFGGPAGIMTKQVVINSNNLPDFQATSYTLGVGGTLRVTEFSSPNYQLSIDTFKADTVVVNTIGPYSLLSIYVSSGQIGLSTGTLFIPEQTTLLQRSTNTIQPSYSTLQFNSTLFVSQSNQAVGIGTFPNYMLDVRGTLYAPSSVLTTTSTFIQGQIRMNQDQDPLWYATCTDACNTSIHLKYSSDGETWIEDPVQETYYNVANDGGRFSIRPTNTVQGSNTWVLVGDKGISYSNTVTNTWTDAELNTSVVGIVFTNVAFNGQLWVATTLFDMCNVTYNSNTQPFVTLMVSTDAKIWQPIASGGFTYGVGRYFGGKSIVWNGSLWVAVGYGSQDTNTILTSSDGSNWNNIISGGFYDVINGLGYGTSILWNGSNWLGYGSDGCNSMLQTSTDGLHWTSASANGLPLGSALAFDGHRYVAITDSGNMFYSDDPFAFTPCNCNSNCNTSINWQAAAGSMFSGSGFCVVWNGFYWLAGGIDGVRKSYDGINWVQPPTAPTINFTGLSFSSNALPSLVIGASTLQSFSTITSVSFDLVLGDGTGCNFPTTQYSSDGIQWIAEDCNNYFATAGYAATWDGSTRWVSAGDGGGVQSNLRTSINGRTWTDCILPPNGYYTVGVGRTVSYGVTNNVGYWASGHTSSGTPCNPTMYYSTDGKIWETAIGQYFNEACYGIAYGKISAPHSDAVWVAVGGDPGGQTILYSILNQQGAADPGPPTCYTSYNVTNHFDIRGYGIAYNGSNLWVAVGEDSGGYVIKYASDFQTWVNATGTLFATSGRGVAYNGSNLWVAVGDSGGGGGTILWSVNGQTWSGSLSGEFTTIAYGIAYNPYSQLWIAAGALEGSTSIKYSGDGKNWSNASGGVFASAAYGVGVSGASRTTQTSYYNQLRLYNNPGVNVTSREATTYIAYSSTLVDFNNVLRIDTNHNVHLFYPSTLTGFTSTFYEAGRMNVSGVLTTPSLQGGNGLFMGFQNV